MRIKANSTWADQSNKYWNIKSGTNNWYEKKSISIFVTDVNEKLEIIKMRYSISSCEVILM